MSKDKKTPITLERRLQDLLGGEPYLCGSLTEAGAAGSLNGVVAVGVHGPSDDEKIMVAMAMVADFFRIPQVNIVGEYRTRLGNEECTALAVRVVGPGNMLGYRFPEPLPSKFRTW